MQTAYFSFGKRPTFLLEKEKVGKRKQHKKRMQIFVLNAKKKEEVGKRKQYGIFVKGTHLAKPPSAEGGFCGVPPSLRRAKK